MPCFDLSGFTGLSQGLFQTYLSQWNTFERIYYFNSNVSTQYSQAKIPPIYYNFFNSVEAIDYRVGQQLHTQRYPNSNWTSPEKS